jgi:hypothetical protein
VKFSTSIIPLLLFVTSALAIETNTVYLRPEGGVPLSGEASTNAYEMQGNEAKDLPESRPAELDPDGHWGAISSDLQLSIRFSTNIFMVGDPIEATVILRNTSTNAVILPTSGPWTMDFSAMTQRKGTLKPADRSKWYRYSGPANLPLRSRRQISYRFKLNDIFDLQAPGKYRLSAKRLKDKWGELPEIESGTAEITIVPREPGRLPKDE